MPLIMRGFKVLWLKLTSLIIARGHCALCTLRVLALICYQFPFIRGGEEDEHPGACSPFGFCWLCVACSPTEAELSQLWMGYDATVFMLLHILLHESNTQNWVSPFVIGIFTYTYVSFRWQMSSEEEYLSVWNMIYCPLLAAMVVINSFSNKEPNYVEGERKSNVSTLSLAQF